MGALLPTRIERGEEERDRGKKKRYFTALLSHRNSEINILFDPVSTSKFDKKQSIYQQTAPFNMSGSKGKSLSVSQCKFCLFLIIIL
jgi:hypothetical protein